ncbi:UvrD-helicase domain-containing protein [Acidipropionibacterium jensenii]|uniref:UvrD-helicase domain-containing protein n=1 Tax=Acidipropionibacterium jensenii TaxID=1749 RepID=UPI00214B0A7E|nr:UvrD-helicase domain-containing protein [Acidipropionibacterium jensenii]
MSDPTPQPTSPAPAPFDITAELPHGTTLLEASAGTGKTWAIAAVVTRAIAAGQVRTDQLLLVTFNRSAARELRSRVHARLVRAHRLLSGADRVADHRELDELDTVLVAAPRQVRSAMATRLTAALDHFEDATITTTHEFSSRMLAELGVLADHDPSSRLLADAGPLADQVAADLYLASHLDQTDPPAPAATLRLAREVAVKYREVELGQQVSTARSVQRMRLARQLRDRVGLRAHAERWHTFDDLIADLAAALADPLRGPAAVATLARRFTLVMVDEFQDTDPLQWQVLDRAFRGRVDLWLIGDPKQSIYAFRGADIHSYLDAADRVDSVLALDVNRRTDAPVVAGVGHLFGPALLGDPRIRVTPVRAWHSGSRLAGDTAAAHHYDWSHPVQLRCIRTEGSTTMDSLTADRLVAEDLANQIVMMLDGGSTWVDEQGAARSLTAPDIAILVRTRKRGSQIREALTAAGQPAVFSGDESVWRSRAATDLIDLLDALTLIDPAVLARLALCPLGGGRPEELVRAASRVRPELAVAIGSWARRWPDLGVWGVVDEALRRPGVMTTMLAGAGGERYLTDLRQIAQAAQADDLLNRTPASPATVAEWLRDQADSSSVESPRRLETDRRAVTIMTIHQAKGLGFPVVLLPDAARSWPLRDHQEPMVWHHDGRRLLDLGDPGPGRDQVWQSHLADQRAEDLRTLYVGMTRARSAVRLWWTPDRRQHRGSPLHRLLCFDHHSAQTPGPGDGEIDPSRLGWLDPDLLDVVQVPRQMLLRRAAQVVGAPVGAARVLDRRIDRDWGRTSYSGLTEGLHSDLGQLAPDQPLTDGQPSAGRSPDARGEDQTGGLDEPEEATDPAPQPGATGGSAAGAGAGLCAMPGGTAFGTLVHAILERVRPVSEGLADDVGARTAEVLAQTPLEGVTAPQLAEGLTDVMRTPLGPLTGDLRLCDIGPANRLAELNFELAMADSSERASSLAGIAAALADPGLVPPEDPLAGYGAVLAASPAADRLLAGFLTGSLDAVLRLPDQRHVIIDYKTNRVPMPPGAALTPDSYDQPAMAAMMIGSHYPLQAILYSAALHRFLAARLSGYDPARHLGGVGYLFVRGMTPDHGHGIFAWYPRPELIVRVSEVLTGRRDD